MIDRTLRFFLEQKFITFTLTGLLLLAGLSYAPFKEWGLSGLPKHPISVDAIPDIGENQQIVYAEWPGRSPQDVENQITYPLTSALLGIPGVKTVRSTSMPDFSSISIIFNDDIDFYFSRSRILEKLNALPANLLPEGVKPALGPDATALGQVFWYTLEGRDEHGNAAQVWEPQELRAIQDFYVRFGLASTEGVAEVASIGGFVKEYQVELDPVRLKAYGVMLESVVAAVQKSNRDVGAQTLEVNRVEYMIRGIGYLTSTDELEWAVVDVKNGKPVRLGDIARIQTGPAPRRGGLDKNGAEAVGGVVVARFGANPMDVISEVKKRISELEAGMPVKTLPDGSTAKVTIVPFYDRSGLIQETLATLEDALVEEILITVIVILVMVVNLRASLLVSLLLPFGVLLAFIAMKWTGVDANIVALSGIAIAIGVMVDIGIVISENILQHLEADAVSEEKKPLTDIIFNASREVFAPVMTALATTVISFLPVFALEASEGKLFRPLAFTKTYAMIAAMLVAFTVVPALAHVIFKPVSPRISRFFGHWIAAFAASVALFISGFHTSGFLMAGFAVVILLPQFLKTFTVDRQQYARTGIAAVAVIWMLGRGWMPLGADYSLLANVAGTALLAGTILGLLALLVRYYESILGWALAHKKAFLSIPGLMILFGSLSWFGGERLFGWFRDGAHAIGWEVGKSRGWSTLVHRFPGLGSEFMPSLDEGSFLLMPTSMPHAGVEENRAITAELDMRVMQIPEVDAVVGKWGRVESALDPAPVNMFENVIQYKTEFISDENGRKLRFRTDSKGAFLRDEAGNLIPDENGRYFRQWRDHIKTKDDLWKEIQRAATIPGVTGAPKLQPIETRLVMLSTGMRANLGIKVFGPDLERIEAGGKVLERILKTVPSIEPASVFAERNVGKPYLEINWNRQELARFGLSIDDVQMQLELGLGGMPLTYTVEGRERFAVRIRFARDVRNDAASLENLPVSTPMNGTVPLKQLAELVYTAGPMMIRSEDTFLTSYVTFDKKPGWAEVDVVRQAGMAVNRALESGEASLPDGVRFRFSGQYENQVRAQARLNVLIPVCLLLVFVLIYFQFRSTLQTALIFTGVVVCVAGGFTFIWLYQQPWFLNFPVFGIHLRDVFHIHPVHLSVAVWVGFIALFGLATDDGVLVQTFLSERFKGFKPESVQEIRAAVVEGGKRRARAAAMTTATTLIALLPVLTSSGKGSDIMIPMSVPLFGGMVFEAITMLVVPVLFCAVEEFTFKRRKKTE
jgi:Cu(I)/Ag(I) efflux system membrane protein CusA/SilA